MRAATGPGRAHFIRGFKRTQTMHSDDKLKLDDVRVFNFDGYEREDIHVCVRALADAIAKSGNAQDRRLGRHPAQDRMVMHAVLSRVARLRQRMSSSTPATRRKPTTDQRRDVP